MNKNVDPRVRKVGEIRQCFEGLRAVSDWMYGVIAGGEARNCKLASQITAMAVTEIAERVECGEPSPLCFIETQSGEGSPHSTR